MKQLSGFMALSVNGGNRITFTYDEIDGETGELTKSNVKENFFAVDSELNTHIEAIRNWISTHKLTE